MRFLNAILHQITIKNFINMNLAPLGYSISYTNAEVVVVHAGRWGLVFDYS